MNGLHELYYDSMTLTYTMRPEILHPFFKSLSAFLGIGPQRQKKIEQTIGVHPIDLLFHLPYALETRYEHSHLSTCISGTRVTIIVEIVDIQKTPQRTTIWASDGHETMALVYFNTNAQWLKRLYTVGHKKLISGKIDVFHGQKQIIHPDFVGAPSQKNKWVGSVPLYRSVQAVGQARYRALIQEILKCIPNLPEWIPKDVLTQHHWPSFTQALRQVHSPKILEDLSPDSPARMRLGFDELYHYQLCLTQTYISSNKRQRFYQNASPSLRQQAEELLPYQLTQGQQDVLQNLDASLQSDEVMRALLMGDVGSGKTIVAFLTALKALENKGQVALLAPTTLLAQQHYETLFSYCQELGIAVDLLTSNTKNKTQIKNALKSGDISFIIGTHTLIQETVGFNDLALIIIDEQHRFGVEQRQVLTKLSPSPDLLYLSATPIPRTLAMTLYGQMDIYALSEKPKNRQPIETLVMPTTKLEPLYQWIHKIIATGFKVYWVCPLIEKSEELDVTSIEERLPTLKKHFPNKIYVVHGQLKSGDKEKAMQAFREDPEASILLSTTVIEVGVDVPDAAVMVIENAERFGLSQLHQLRGRVGRSHHQSYCVLLYTPPLSQTTQQRLKVMKTSEDGFHIAEEDLKIRGSGDLLGTEQSGVPRFRLASLSHHLGLISLAKGCVTKEPGNNEGVATHILTNLFRKSTFTDA